MNSNRVPAQRIPILKVVNFFSWIIIIMYMRLKFQSTGHLKPSKYLYWELLFSAKIRTTWYLWGDFQCLKCSIFFHRSSLFHIWGLSSKAWTLWTLRTCLNPYPIVQILIKSFLGLGGGQISSNQKTSFTKKFSIDPRNLIPDGCSQIQNLHFINYPHLCFHCQILLIQSNYKYTNQIIIWY